MPYDYEPESAFHAEEMDPDLIAFIYDADAEDLAPYEAMAMQEAA